MAAKYSLFNYIIDAFNDGEIKMLESIGVDLDLAKELADLNSCEIHSLNKSSGSCLKLRIDSDMMKHLIEHHKKQSQEQSLIEQAICLKATYTMVSSYASIDRIQFQRISQRLGIVHARQGRPKELDDNEITLATEQWITHKKLPELERYILIANKTGLSLARLFRYFGTNESYHV